MILIRMGNKFIILLFTFLAHVHPGLASYSYPVAVVKETSAMMMPEPAAGYGYGFNQNHHHKQQQNQKDLLVNDNEPKKIWLRVYPTQVRYKIQATFMVWPKGGGKKGQNEKEFTTE